VLARSFFVFLVISLMLVSSQYASAHWDVPPAGSPYHITVILKRIDYNEDADDWEDNTSGADLVIGWRVELSGHDLATNSGTIARDDLSLSEGGKLRLDLTILDHDECTPLSDLRLFAWGVESDQDNTLDTNRIMRSVVQNGDISTGPLEAQNRFDSAGDQWMGFSSKVSRGVNAEGTHFEGEMTLPLDEQNRLDAEFLIERHSVTNTGQCNQPANSNPKTAIKSDTAKNVKTSQTNKKTESASQITNELKGIYLIAKQDEKFNSILKKANDAESKALKKLAGDAKSFYSKTKNSDVKKLGDKIQAQIKDAEADKKQISALDVDSKKITKQILAVAKENKITKSELDKAVKDKTDTKNPKGEENTAKPDQSSLGRPLDLNTLDKLAEILFNAKSHYEEEAKINEEEIRKFLQVHRKALEEARQNSENKPDDSKQKDPDAPPESLLDDLDPTIRGPDVNEPKPSKEKPGPKTEKPKTDQQNPDAPPESILDDIDTNYGADIGPKPDKPKSDQKPKQNSGIDHARIAQDDMRIIEESLRQELLDQVRDTQIQIDLERQLKDLKQKIVIDDTKKPIIQKDPKPSEVKPKSTTPEKTEKPIIQKDPVITEPKPSNTKPTLSIPKQVTQEATGPAGANVAFSTSSQDKEDGSLTPVCSPASGATFPIGTTPVSCTVTDSNNNSVSGTFTVTVRDTTPPAFAPFQPTEGVKDDTGVQVFFDVTATDLVDGNVPVSCNYQSGYKFPPGVTELKCTASDSRGNQVTKTVQITVTVSEQ
jgi:hypothetical protein